jgi:DNA polymerase III delta subunit
MLTIICGEDSIASRNYFTAQQKLFSEKNFEIVNIDYHQTLELDENEASSSSLFTQKRVYFTSFLNKKVLKKLSAKTERKIKEIITSTKIQIFDWEEETSARDLKSIKGIIIKEFKPSQNIFKLLDSCYPGNLKTFINYLNILSESTEDIFIFIMLTRHMRNILIVKMGERLPKLASWQIAKLSNQAKYWKTENLINFYQGLHRIDVNSKTNGTPYSVKEAVEILACYYLK